MLSEDKSQQLSVKMFFLFCDFFSFRTLKMHASLDTLICVCECACKMFIMIMTLWNILYLEAAAQNQKSFWILECHFLTNPL